jgi:pimeloyl-ACP methyl ester carboxylesterase
VLEHYDGFLARWPVPFATRVVDTRHGRTAVHVCGRADGPALVLIHGAGSNALMWIGDVEGWARDFRVFAIDVVGEPGRSAPVRPPLKGPAYSDWLAEVLDGLGLARATLVGLSQGGWIALKLATTRPERVERLVLLSPAGVVRDRLGFVLRAVPLLCGANAGPAPSSAWPSAPR